MSSFSVGAPVEAGAVHRQMHRGSPPRGGHHPKEKRGEKTREEAVRWKTTNT